jgi:hypothetical protein
MGKDFQDEAMTFHSTLSWGSNQWDNSHQDGMLAWQANVSANDEEFSFHPSWPLDRLASRDEVFHPMQLSNMTLHSYPSMDYRHHSKGNIL